MAQTMQAQKTDVPFYVKFERTEENLALLAYLLTLPEQRFEVFDYAKNTVKDTAQILSDYQDIIHQMEENYDPVYDEDYINSLIKSATPEWSKIKDKDKWLHELRGVELLNQF